MAAETEEQEDFESQLGRMLSQEEEGAGPKPMVFFVDLYHKEHPRDRLIERLVEVIAKATKTKEFYAMLLVPSDTELEKILRETKLPEGDHVTCHKIFTTNKIEAFYKAKDFMDVNGLSKMAMICGVEQSGYWKQLGDLFFTKAYQMYFATIGTGKMELTALYGLECEIDTYLQTLPSIGKLEVFKSPIIPSDIFNHGFTTRNGGISNSPALRSLNLAFATRKRDSMVIINENRRRLGEAVGFNHKNMQFPKVEHGPQVWTIGGDVPSGYDAIVTRNQGITVAAPGADCVMILYADPVNRVCAAAHAGWRGTLKGISLTTVNSMVRDFRCDVNNIVVAMGPCLSTKNLQFSPEDAAGFEEIDPSLVTKQPGDSKVYVDLLKTNTILLQRVGIRPENIDTSCSMCTFENEDKLYSFRREKFPFGNQIGFINIR